MALWRVRVDLSGTAGGPGVSTYYFADDVITAQQAADAVGDLWTDPFSAEMANDVAWQVESEVDGIDLDGTLTAVENVTGASGNGTLTGEPLPWATQYLVRWGTNLIVNGRRLQGKTFVPGPTEDGNDNGVPSSTVISDMNTALNAFVVANAGIFGIWSKTHAAFGVVGSGTLWNEFAVLRSRRD
jgi:hypothetical protein